MHVLSCTCTAKISRLNWILKNVMLGVKLHFEIIFLAYKLVSTSTGIIFLYGHIKKGLFILYIFCCTIRI